MNSKTKEIFGIIFFAIIYSVIAVLAGSIAHEYYHQWSLRNVVYDGELIWNPVECGNGALFCYRYHVLPEKQFEYKQKLKFEEIYAYALTFVVGFVISLCLLLSHLKIETKIEKYKEERKDVGIMCVKCGKEATKGSYKHPYCIECFEKVYGDDYDKYEKDVRSNHHL